ncbi:ubiquitin-like protein [Hamiltosporidium tvaerminnensis]|uniref:Ubiquitin-like protein n=2 Tax=Hamiltosporidium TaxID=1176354 RepID=A0A4Q9L3P2_9MICR|nr:Ubiquilin-1 [Hamiltosporidium tvaerminnensis]TBU02107.1 ubiquitin-like protein [Hamiltosporidium tvaerminnensis]TBU04805.1 ubiquitin-like protein [Hamiltosporidium magnivora]TBU20285.1 ubiquitin-like protein [Hamiltosporidium tvaerminnensis]
MTITLTIKHQSRSKELSLEINTSLKDLKTEIESIFCIPVSLQLVFYKDRLLTDESKSLKELDIINESEITVRKKNITVQNVQPKQKESFEKIILSNPMVKNMLKRPEALKSMLDMYPSLKKEMEKNSELRNIMNNPQTFEEFEKMTDNPEYMSQQLKNIDIAMSRLSNIPGGLNMMNSMLKEVRDPVSMAMGPQNTKDFSTGESIEMQVTDAIYNPEQSSENNPIFKYRKELDELKQIGFSDMAKNLEALQLYDGDIESVITFLATEPEKNAL